MSEIDYTTPLGAARLKEDIESGFRMIGGQRQKYMDSMCYDVTSNVKAKRKAFLEVGTVNMNKQTDSKGKVNQEKIEINKKFAELCQYDAELCFDFEELNYLEGDIMGAASTRLRQASDKERDVAAIEALFGEIMRGDPCKVTVERDLCHIAHDGLGLTPEKVLAAIQAIGGFYPGSSVTIGMTNASMIGMTNHPVWTNNDFLFSGATSAYAGMMKSWGRAMFKYIPDHWNTDDIGTDPNGFLEPIIPATPYIPAGGAWDGKSFIRFLPVWVKEAVTLMNGYSTQVTPFPDAWKYRSLAKGVGLIRIDDQFGFNAMNERARAVICVIEEDKSLAESYIKRKGRGFGIPGDITVA